ncbi:MAG: alpha/beta hydrolase [Sphingomonas bacterium]|uniref:alpha/beta hydrolase n=1 Tax=Sphingomonas bacterium TaxID=1895847 RepID=UPI00262EA9EE|nr:alpha/beta hydrolase [Sphingomonas bacterium]MDB5707645.1 alpha/beta hydrolase [Sphingomonas bacterium]
MARSISRLGAFSLCLALATSAVAAAPGQRVFPTADRPPSADPYPDRVTHFPGGVTSLADVVYSVIPGYRPMILDIYMPPKGKTATPKPLVIYVHGGGWVGGHTRAGGALSDFPKVLASLAAEGFVVASVEYRFSAEARFPAQLDDMRAAIRFLKGNAGKYGIDPSRVGIWGASAGGHLAALAALSCGAPGFDAKPQPAGSECVQAAAIWYGVFDFAPIVARAEGSPVALIGCADAASCPADRIKAVSPLTYLDAGDPPFLLIHGENDHTVAVSQSKDAYAKMKTAGLKVDEIIIPDVDHSFIGKTPAATRAATLRAVNATFDFFHAQLGK